RRFKGLVGLNQESATKYTSQGSSPFGSVSLTRLLRQTTWKELAITLRCFPCSRINDNALNPAS
ncbi:hypothetical protein, partial [Vibrio harveyi]|uniref:hypothetical protein n=1 Tax=Vibrio harveyi TaxID=669 RepID=UPI001E551492